MTLLRKTSLIHISVTALLLALAGALIYWIITGLIEEEVTEKLWVNNKRVALQIEAGETPAYLPPVVEFRKIDPAGKEGVRVLDTLVFDPVEGEKELFREVSSFQQISGQWYKITTRQVILEPHDYLESIGASLAIVLVLLLLTLWISNRLISKSIWKPFFMNLEKLRKYELSEHQNLRLQASDITEFRELNQVLEKLIAKVSRDYRNLKEFSENAAHEMQTPLAISQSRLEQVLQNPDLKAEQATEINTSLKAIRRLKRLNQNLILLTMLDNAALDRKEKINLRQLLEQQMKEMEELAEARTISRQTQLENALVEISPLSAELLVSNLLSNAIKHNVEGGEIEIELNEKRLLVKNTGEPLEHPERMLERFAKGSQASSSLGLGLAIVAKICEVQTWRLSYTVQGKEHRIRIEF